MLTTIFRQNQHYKTETNKQTDKPVSLTPAVSLSHFSVKKNFDSLSV